MQGCSDPEDSARKLHNKAITLQQQDRSAEARKIYKEIVAKYPETETAIEANKVLSVLIATEKLIIASKSKATKREDRINDRDIVLVNTESINELPRNLKRESTDDIFKTFTLEFLLQKGERTYYVHCTECHKSDGSGTPPDIPALASNPVLTGSLENLIKIVLHGKDGTEMKGFGDKLYYIELASVITYTRNTWGNQSGDIVQPKDVYTVEIKN